MASDMLMKSEYNDNINFSVKNKENDWIFTYMPQINGSYMNSRDALAFDIQIGIIDFRERNKFDTITQHYAMSYDFQNSPVLNTHLSGAYLQDSTMDDEMEDTGLVSSRSKREKYSLSPNLSWAINERLQCKLFYNHVKFYYDDEDYSDYQVHDGIIQCAYDIKDGRMSLLGEGSYKKYIYGSSIIDYVDHYSFQIGPDYKLSHNLTLSSRAGVSYNKTYIDLPDGREGDLKRSASGFLNLLRTYPRGNISATFSRGTSSSGWLGEVIDQSRMSLVMQYSITQYFMGNLEINWKKAKSENNFWDTNEEYYLLITSFQYQIRENTLIRLSHNYSKSIDQKTDQEGNNNRIFLQLMVYLTESKGFI